MEFTVTMRNKDGKGTGTDQHTLESMREELMAISNVLDALVVGEAIEIKRIS